MSGDPILDAMRAAGAYAQSLPAAPPPPSVNISVWHIVVGVALIVLVLLPAIIAYSQHHPRRLLIALLSVVIGWTGLGWFGLLAWSLAGSGTSGSRR